MAEVDSKVNKIMVHRNIVIRGWVQGVGFRYAARKMAIHWGITGFVRNLPDGSVYIEAEGQEASLDEFTAWCHTGPSRAQIHSVSIEDGPLHEFMDFDIAF
jgi:acylphosphatase